MELDHLNIEPPPPAGVEKPLDFVIGVLRQIHEAALTAGDTHPGPTNIMLPPHMVASLVLLLEQERSTHRRYRRRAVTASAAALIVSTTALAIAVWSLVTR